MSQINGSLPPGSFPSYAALQLRVDRCPPDQRLSRATDPICCDSLRIAIGLGAIAAHS